MGNHNVVDQRIERTPIRGRRYDQVVVNVAVASMAEGIDTRIEANMKLDDDWFKMPAAKSSDARKIVPPQ